MLKLSPETTVSPNIDTTKCYELWNFYWIYLHIFFVGKLLVATGFPLSNGKHIEVIDILNPNVICEPKQNYPLEVYGATGNLIRNNIPLICGGWDGTNNIVFQCYIIG